MIMFETISWTTKACRLQSGWYERPRRPRPRVSTPVGRARRNGAPRLPSGARPVERLRRRPYSAAALLPMLSPLIWAVFIGMAVVAARPLGVRFQPGVRVASRRLLRLGVALLELRLGVGQLVGVWLPGLAVILLVVPLTIGGTLLLGRRLGCPPGLTLLVATGSAICGASAIVAMDAAVEGDEDDVTVAVATVTLFGTAALVVLPILDRLVLHLPAATFGTWVGASVHEVAQVVSAATPAGAAAVKVASVVKLTRVLMLAPLVLAVSLLRRRGGTVERTAVRAPMPLFVAGFLICVAV